jgi:hypothetical protein
LKKAPNGAFFLVLFAAQTGVICKGFNIASVAPDAGAETGNPTDQ